MLLRVEEDVRLTAAVSPTPANNASSMTPINAKSNNERMAKDAT